MPERSAALRRRFGLLLLALLAAALRAHDLAGQSLWSDEDITLDRARLPLSEMLAALPVEHGPLYFAFMRGWTLLAGESDLALRWPSLLAGVVAVPLLFWLGRRLVSARAGWIAGLLAAVNPFLVAYGQEARMYTLLLALAGGAFVAAAGGGRSQGGAGRPRRTFELHDKLRWVACGVLMALAVLTHYYGALAVFALGAWAIHDLVAAWRDGGKKVGPVGAGPGRSPGALGRPATDAPSWRTVLGGWTIAFATAGLLFAPWLPRALRVLEHPGWREAAELGRAPWQLAAAWSAQTGVTAMRPTTGLESAATALYVALALLGLVALLRRRGWRALLLFATPALMATLLLVRNPDFHPRYYFAVLPAWLLLVAAGAAAVGGRSRSSAGAGAEARAGAGAGAGVGPDVRVGADVGATTFGSWAAALLLVLAALPSLGRQYSDPAARKPDYRQLLATVESQSPAAESVLLLDGPSMGLAKRYLDADSDLKLENLRSGTNRERLEEGRDVFDARLAELAERRPHVWLASNGEGEGLADGWLARDLYFAGRKGVQDVALARFYAPQSPQELLILRENSDPIYVPGYPPHDAAVYLAPPLLDLEDHPPLSIDAGAVLPIRLGWRTGDAWADSPPSIAAHRVSLRLVDADGQVVVASDRDPVAGTRPTMSWSAGDRIIDRQALIIPADIVPTDYDVRVLLYDSGTLAPLDSWPLGRVRILDPRGGVNMDATP